MEDILESGVEMAMKKLKLRRAPGLDSVCAEVIKAAGDCSVKWCTNFVTK